MFPLIHGHMGLIPVPTAVKMCPITPWCLQTCVRVCVCVFEQTENTEGL